MSPELQNRWPRLLAGLIALSVFVVATIMMMIVDRFWPRFTAVGQVAVIAAGGITVLTLPAKMVHQTLRVTPAMQAGLTDHVWNITELLTRSGLINSVAVRLA